MKKKSGLQAVMEDALSLKSAHKRKNPYNVDKEVRPSKEPSRGIKQEIKRKHSND